MKKKIISYPFIIFMLTASFLGSCKPSASEYLENGKTKISEGRLQEAISLIDEAIKLAPTNADAFNARGAAHYKLDENSKALANFDKAIELDSTDYRFYLNRANVKRKLNIIQGSFEDYSKALTLDDTHYDIFLNRGIVSMSLAAFGQALADLDQAKALNQGQDPNVLFYRGLALLKLERFADAEKDLRSYLEKVNNRGEAYYHLALALTGQVGEPNEEICGLLARAADKGYAPAKREFQVYCSK